MSNTLIIQVLIMALIVFGLLFSILLQIGRKQIEEKQRNSIFLAGKIGKKGTMYYRLYDFFKEWPVTKRYIKKLTGQFDIIMPGDRMGVKKQTIKTALIIWLLDAIIIIFLFALSPSLFRAIITITYIYAVNNQTFYLKKYKRKLLIQTEKSLNDIRHNYEVHEMVDEAIFDVMTTADYPIKLHLSKIYEILNANDDEIEDEISKYEETAPNKFLKVFLSICVMIQKHGDKKVDDQRVFLTNLRYLRQDVNIEIRNKEKEDWLFRFLSFIAIVPILFLEPIEKWGISCFEKLADYYKGAFGLAVVIIIFLVTIGSYNLLDRLKDNLEIEVKNYVLLNWLSKKKPVKNFLNNILNKNYGKTLRTEELLKKSGESISVRQFLLKRILYGIIAFVVCVSISLLMNVQDRHRILNNAELGIVTSMISQKQEQEIKSSTLEYIREHKQDKVSKQEVQRSLLEKGVIKSHELATLTAQEIVNRINSYQRIYYRWYELLIAFIVGVAAFYIPYMRIRIMKAIRKMVMDDEIIQFHSIILMVMYMAHTSVETILIWMEKFSNVFRKSIQDCINDLQSGEMEALEELKKKEPYEPFIRIVESLQMCDRLPIKKAFNEIHVERYNYQENRKIENEIFLEKKVTIALAIAWAPTFLTLVIYLAIPWVIQALLHLLQQLEQMQSYMK